MAKGGKIKIKNYREFERGAVMDEKGFELQSDEIELILKNHLKIESKVMSIETLLGNARMRNKIVYDPYYQRNYVWDNDKATYFIGNGNSTFSFL